MSFLHATGLARFDMRTSVQAADARLLCPTPMCDGHAVKITSLPCAATRGKARLGAELARHGGEQPGAGGRAAGAGVQQAEAAGAVGVLDLVLATPLAQQRCALISQAACAAACVPAEGE